MKADVGRELFETQKDALRKVHSLCGRAGLFMEMRTGKTRVSLVYTEFRKCRRVLVVCPISVIGVWEDEAASIEYSLPVIDLTAAGSIKERADRLKRTSDALVLINYESYWREPLRSAIIKWNPEAVILDEAHRIRHRGSRHSRFAHTFANRNTPIRLAPTGTPVTNGLQDVWSVYRFIDPDVFGRRYDDFAREHIIMGGYGGYEIKGYRNEPLVHQKIAATSYQAAAEHQIEFEDVRVPVRLSARAMEAYRELKKESIAEVVSAKGTHVVLARIVLTLIMRLHQITSGFIRDEETHEEVTISSDKRDVAIELIEDAVAQGRKVVVFARFLHDITSLRAAMPKGVRFATLTGAAKAAQRSTVRRDFQAGKYDVILAQVKVASLGIDLASASVAIFFSVGFSLDEFLQAKARLLGPAQKRSVTFYHLVARGTVDEKIYDALQAKIAIAGRVTDLQYALDLLDEDRPKLT